MSENKLKTCPFCGGEAELVIAPSNQYMGIPCYAIACKHCKVMMGTVQEGRTDFYRTPQEAIKVWNIRKPMERIVEQLHNAGGCDGTNDYDKGWDDAIAEAEGIVKKGGAE